MTRAKEQAAGIALAIVLGIYFAAMLVHGLSQ
jgi:hypothetical protein